ncbi:universal stress protein in QAH/OAS sulfhydrylase 3'region-like isoform X1 [Ruditapes philippinarum]|uniref:universal stress protein in QAH/OAS sulfhydrylase 3'region-like isoform X1 n=1 Tax=Ruditapes philippinarum TaxID=129788 RepID=UPI00295BCC2B|nr:universal stress protein in QAH/OAS sulfhydrylase 3'region-like isoform X1 [Ruditapes philippinarum]
MPDNLRWENKKITMSDRRTIVIAIDDSFHSEFAFDFYVNNVHKDGDRIVLVHVPEYSHILSTSSLLTDPNIVSDLLKDNEERIHELIEKYSVKMKDSHLSGHVKQQCGKPGEAIVEAAKEEGASMLILGTRGMGLIRRTFTGSVSDYCLHHADVPVLVCRHKPHIKHTSDHHS